MIYKENFGHIILDEYEENDLELQILTLRSQKLANKVNDFIKTSIDKVLSKYKILAHDTSYFQGKVEDYLFYNLTWDALGYDLTISSKPSWTSSEQRVAQFNMWGIYFSHYYENFEEYLVRLEELCKEIRK